MVTTENFLRFWAKAIPNVQVHPDDVAALDGNRHDLARDVLVGPFMGPVRAAPVVLLTLNGGLGKEGVEQREATIPSAREEMARNLLGDAPLPSFATNPGGREWTERLLAQFGLCYESAAPKVAFINLIPYRSMSGSQDMRMAKLLPSSRMVLAWAHDTLFPEGEAGKRVVVCLRSARAWGLDPDTPQRGQSLFTPYFNRRGIMCHVDRNGEPSPMREKVGTAVRRAVGLAP
jgi:hypothetical protein